jgi:hypothetical protein
MLKAIACFFLPFLRKRPCTCGDPLAAATVTVTVSTEPPRPRPSTPPTCSVCKGQRTLLVKVGYMMGMPVFQTHPCRCCGGAGVIPRVVAERIRADPLTARDYHNAFLSN